MDKSTEKLLLYGGVAVAGYFFVIRPILEKINIVPDQQERFLQRSDAAAVNEQARLRVPNAGRTYSDVTLQGIARQLFDSTNKFSFDYELVLKNMAFFSGFRNADAIFFLKAFASLNATTLYQWQRAKFANTNNFRTVDMYPATYLRYRANFQRMGYVLNPFTNASFDIITDISVNYVYTVAKISKR